MKFRLLDYRLSLSAALIGAVSSSAAAGPGTPTDVEAIAVSPTQVEVHLTNTAEDDEEIWIEVEQTTNGARISPHAEAELSAQFNLPTYNLTLQFRSAR